MKKDRIDCLIILASITALVIGIAVMRPLLHSPQSKEVKIGSCFHDGGIFYQVIDIGEQSILGQDIKTPTSKALFKKKFYNNLTLVDCKFVGEI